MVVHTGFGAKFCREPCHVGIDDVGIFTMRHDGHLHGFENLTQGFLLVHQHVAGGRAHEEFHAGHFTGIYAAKQIHIVGCGTDEKAVVDATLARCDFPLCFQVFGRCGLRHGVGHVEHRGNTAGSRRPTFAFHVGLVSESRLTEVNVFIDDPGQQEASRSIHNDVGRC